MRPRWSHLCRRLRRGARSVISRVRTRFIRLPPRLEGGGGLRSPIGLLRQSSEWPTRWPRPLRVGPGGKKALGTSSRSGTSRLGNHLSGWKSGGFGPIRRPWSLSRLRGACCGKRSRGLVPGGAFNRPLMLPGAPRPGWSLRMELHRSTLSPFLRKRRRAGITPRCRCPRGQLRPAGRRGTP